MLASLLWLVWPILFAGTMMGAGAVFTFNETALAYSLNLICGLLLPARGILYIIYSVRRGFRLRPGMWVQTLMEILLSFAIVFLPRISYQGYLIFLVLFFSFHMVLQGIHTGIYWKNRIAQYAVPAMCQAIVYFQLFLALLFLPDSLRYRLVMVGSGMFIAILGNAYICEGLSVILRNKAVAGVFHRIAITMPGFSGLGVPARLMSTLKESEEDDSCQVQVIFNFGKGGKGIAGHCELCVDGKTYTYGNYDPTSRFLFRIGGDGVVFTAKCSDRVQWLLEQNRTVVSYGLNLNEEQMSQLRQSLLQLQSTLDPWSRPEADTDPREYIHVAQQKLHCKAWRIRKGRFRTYFLPSINCVNFTADLLKGTAASSVIIPGVYTPGGYMGALHRLYVAGNDVVVSAQIRHPQPSAVKG